MVGKRQHRRSSSVRNPHFFKVLLGDFAQRLKIPSNFLKHISREVSKRAILEGPSGGSWHVGLGETINGTFLSTGWSKFVKDHCLKEHEFLVFRYNGNMRFSIQVFDTTACEREDLFTSECHKKSKLCGGRKELTTIKPHKKPKLPEGRKKRGRPAKNTLDDCCLLEHQEIKIEVPEFLTYDHQPPDQLQDYSFNSMQGSCVTSSKSSGSAKTKIEKKDRPVRLAGSKTILQGGYFSRRRDVTAEERSRSLAAANSFISVFPCVRLRMTVTSVYRTYMLRFPTRFSRAYLPRKRTNFVLRDPNGKAWVVVYVPSTRDRLSGGWSAFARGNNLEEGDFCAFELVGPVEFRVHIFRVVDEITPLVRISKM